MEQPLMSCSLSVRTIDNDFISVNAESMLVIWLHRFRDTRPLLDCEPNDLE